MLQRESLLHPRYCLGPARCKLFRDGTQFGVGSAITITPRTQIQQHRQKIAAGLVDELQFYINPAALGGGTRIFDQAGFRKLCLLGSKAYDCGIVVNRYAPALSPRRARHLAEGVRPSPLSSLLLVATD
jgi:hypothetical protein